MIYTNWNIMYLSIYIYIYSCYEVVISPAGSRAMIRVSWGQGQCQNTHACPLPIPIVCTPAFWMNIHIHLIIFGVFTLYIDILSLP